jgi:hypothetical protein
MSLYAQAIQTALTAFRNNVGQFLQWHLVMAVCAVLPVAVFSGEVGTAYRSVLFFDELGFWIQVVVGAALAMASHALMALIIKHACPLTLMVASTAKVRFSLSNPHLLFTHSCFLFFSNRLVYRRSWPRLSLETLCQAM